jgi:hypothetical protein
MACVPLVHPSPPCCVLDLVLHQVSQHVSEGGGQGRDDVPWSMYLLMTTKAFAGTSQGQHSDKGPLEPALPCPALPYPGQMALTVMLRWASSRARVLVNPATPCLAACAYALDNKKQVVQAEARNTTL